MKIADIRDPALFQRLVAKIMAAERGRFFQIVDDSGGDAGNDGYDSEQAALYALYCPEKRENDAAFLLKGRSDLAKAVRLAGVEGYSIREWVFVTPAALREPVHRALRAEATAAALKGTFMSSEHLEPLYLRHPELRPLFPELDYPRIDEELRQINSKLDALVEPIQEKAAAVGSDPEPSSSATQDRLFYFRELFTGYATPEFTELQRRLYEGDATAEADLERLQYESGSYAMAALALGVRIDFEQDRLNFSRVVTLAREAERLADLAGLDAEAAMFFARRTHAETMLVARRHQDLSANLGVGAAAGLPMVSDGEMREYLESIPQRRSVLRQQYGMAYSRARASGNLAAVYYVALLQAATFTQEAFSLIMLRNLTGRGDVAAALPELKQRTETAYALAISVAAAINDKARLAAAYSNYANDLRPYGDTAKALAHARHALDLAREVLDSDQIARTQRLIALLEEDARRGVVAT